MNRHWHGLLRGDTDWVVPDRDGTASGCATSHPAQRLRNAEGVQVKAARHLMPGLVLLAAALVACGESGPASRTVPPSAPTSTEDANERPTATEDGQVEPVTLHVSNQSFDDPSVDVSISIDGTVVVDRQFDVEDQHNWVEFDLALPAGEHDVVASSDSGVETTFTFTTEEDEPRWLVVDYWFSEEHERDGEGGRFTFNVSDEPVGFD